MSADREGQRLVGGLWCGEVLAVLPDFVDGDLSPEQVAAAHAHLAGCDWCERFGHEYGVVVAALRSEVEVHLDDDLAERLSARLLDLDRA